MELVERSVGWQQSVGGRVHRPTFWNFMYCGEASDQMPASAPL